MPTQINMPQASDTMTEGAVVRWLKKEGDKVQANEVVVEIETDKAVMEHESFEAGTIAVVLVKEGEKVPVGATLAVVAVAGENVEAIKKQFASGAAKSAGSTNASAAVAPVSAVQAGSAAPAPQAAPVEQKPAARQAVENPGQHIPAGATMSERPGPSTSPIIAPAHAQAPHDAGTAVATVATNGGGNGRIMASPLANRMAAGKGIDLNLVHGSGPGGRIVQKDIESFVPPAVKGAASESPDKPAVATRISRGTTDIQPMSKMRTAIATALQRSKQMIPHFYVTVDVDVEELFNLRVRLNKLMEAEGVKVSVNDFVTKAAAAALIKHPALNAHFTGDSITRFGDVHIGVAVAIPDGLIVPVIKNADQMGLKELQQRTAELAKKAKALKLKSDEMKGATFTISNLGMFGVKDFSAIINPPEVAILAVAAAEKRAVVRRDQVVARWTMSLTLSVDHRAVDGAMAAEFLRTLKGLLEEPGMMLV